MDSLIDKTIVSDNAELRELVEEATVNALVAGALYGARKASGLAQNQLAIRSSNSEVSVRR